MNITWLGHAAFLVESAGVRIMLDPYRSPDAGDYAPIDTAADVVLVSHINEKYHSHWDAALGNPVRLNGLDFADDVHGHTVSGITFRAIKVYEAPEREVPVSMPYFQLEGMTICHSGDLGHALSADELAPIQGCDIFLAVAGGPPTVALPELKTIMDRLQPKIVIPMHYQTGKVNLRLLPIDDLLAFFDPSDIIFHPSPTLEITKDILPEHTKIYVLPSAR